MKAPDFQKILAQKMIPSAKKLIGHNYIMQMDNDPKHKAKSTTKFLKSKRIKVLDPWPSQSLDINPIEHCDTFKKKVSMHKCSNINELFNVCDLEWKNITSEECKKLVRSMNNRLMSVIKAKGGHTKY